MDRRRFIKTTGLVSFAVFTSSGFLLNGFEQQIHVIGIGGAGRNTVEYAKNTLTQGINYTIISSNLSHKGDSIRRINYHPDKNARKFKFWDQMKVQIPGNIQPVFKKEGRNKTFSFGSVVKARKNEAEDNTTSQTVKYPIHTRRDHLRLKLKSKQYLAIDKLSDDPVMYGNLMHEIFAGVVVKNDIDTVVNKYLYEGVISAKQAKDILNYMHAKLNMSMVKDWFSGRYKVVKERDIIIDGKVDRPDRVMIEGDKAIVVDYKFGDKDPTIHAKQVNNYMQRLTMLGYKQLEGYVWYISMDEVIKVEQ